MKKTLLIILALMLLGTFNANAQKLTSSKDKEEGFQFTTIKELPITGIRNQYRSSTCWAHSGLALMEAEALRIKGINNEKRNIFTENLKNEVGKKYTYSFLIHSKNKYYCTDLVTRVAKTIDINLNYDLFISTGNDIIVSNNTFIIFVCKKTDIKNKIINLYYMSEV